MQCAETVARLKKIVVVPIVRTPDANTALHAVEAVAEGGIPCVEITMTVGGAVQALEEVSKRWGSELLLGAGTVLDPETARACLDAGAEFFVTPSLNPATITFARRYSKAIFPGALTPTEILAAWEAGADGVKVFPCSALGGAKYIKALRGPFPQIELVPTGGVSLATLPEFLEAGCSAVGVGNELVDSQTVASGNYRLITERAVALREKVDEWRASRKKQAAASVGDGASTTRQSL